MRLLITALMASGVVAFSPAATAGQVRTETVKFAAGTSGATIGGEVKGRDTINYKVGAAAGQNMTVQLNSKSDAIYFNVFEPGKMPGSDEALFIGSTEGNRFAEALPATGDYLVQVYLVRAAARRNEQAKFTLDISIGAKAADAGSGSGDAMVPGTDFNATGEIGCARGTGQPMGRCKFGVKRAGGGNGTITVFWPDGGSRVIMFEDQTPVSYDASQADGGAKMTVGKNADLYTVTIGDQRFEFPEAVITGG